MFIGTPCTVKWNVNLTKMECVVFSVYSDSCSISSEDLGIPRLNDDHLGIILKGTVSVSVKMAMPDSQLGFPFFRNQISILEME